MQLSKRILLPLVAVLVLGAGWAKPALADDATVLKFSICGGPIALPTEQSAPFPGAIGGIINCDGSFPEDINYVETLTALVKDGTPIGSLGDATFVFPDGTVSTSNLSLIVGANEDGSVLYVKSIGIITNGTGAYAGASGGFLSESQVSATSFEFTTNVKMYLFDD